MKKTVIIALFFIGLGLSANTITGKVINVADGDTITVLTANKESHRIRLNDIDAPESKQAFGNKSKENLKKYVNQKEVVVKYNSKDRYGRILGTVYLNNTDINLQQVKDGYAWVYRQYSKKSEYYKAEEVARKMKLGLWFDKNPIEPQEFRKMNRR
ncbi:thermonuclease family protein [Aliarcobacter skirrowii]|uniref:thermonuclease family protein n=1 Tax=Aliarcobacter skirrowii TaxID=28200 RepID=UPI0029A69BA1|nr:thermonuclease family protein [Aliarcobacter skirrowii]MDX4028353.1 thermonuclease family protein [Aliarcobacter skirrowii]